MRIGIRKIHFHLSGSEFDQILSGEKTELIYPVNPSWRKKVIHPKTLDFYRVYHISISAGRIEQRKTLRFTLNEVKTRTVKRGPYGRPEDHYVFELIR